MPSCLLQDRFFPQNVTFHHRHPYHHPYPSYRGCEDTLFSPTAPLTSPKPLDSPLKWVHPQLELQWKNEIDLLPRVVMQCVPIQTKVSGQRLAQVIHRCCCYCPDCQLLSQFSPSVVLLTSSYEHNLRPVCSCYWPANILQIQLFSELSLSSKASDESWLPVMDLSLFRLVL